MKRSVTTYLVLQRRRSWGGSARVIRTTAKAPTLQRGEVAVRIQLSVPDEAFRDPRRPAPLAEVAAPLIGVSKRTQAGGCRVIRELEGLGLAKLHADNYVRTEEAV